ncbi:hypothetical protein EJ04DRAFT_482857 [Polyplosphaeria fusca]|uniref:F-box domain-containing protein n=1 Tax=Polyplosphaeria fusca TaxID=682080 RepID=A0A9P4R6T4_9PLEO|nr:hypothetical protein EJ04DRAFT_482857 [Polyplosphaeria fusca]
MDQHDNCDRATATAFSFLSTDLKLDIFDYVRSKYDQGNARLVCKEWNHFVKSQMWRNITTTLGGSFMEHTRKLLEEQEFCLHDIRVLHVGGKYAIPNYQTIDESRVWTRSVGPDYDASFSGFMGLLRKDQLLEFSSPKDTPLTSTQFLRLLHRQSNLRTFRARLDLADIAAEDRASWHSEHCSSITSALRSLKSLRIYAGERVAKDSHRRGRHIMVPSLRGDFEMSCNGPLLRSVPLLDCLEICGWPHYYGCWKGDRRDIWCGPHRVPLMAILANPADPICFPGSLTRLILADVDLLDGTDTFLNGINIATLRELKLMFCKEPWPLLRSLAACLRQTTTQLKVLVIRRPIVDTKGMRECQRGVMTELLTSFSGLEELEFDTMWAQCVNWKTCLANHGTLKKLLVSSNFCFGELIWTDTIASIFEQCPDLESFAYRPERKSGPRDENPVLELPSSLPSLLCESLNVVAAMAPNLAMLRLLFAPGLEISDRYHPLTIREDPEWTKKAGRSARRYATLILTYLHSKGSNIKMLALSPNSRWEQHRGDSNLQYYPHYFFRPRIVEHKKNQRVVAVPVRDYFAEYPEEAPFV